MLREIRNIARFESHGTLSINNRSSLRHPDTSRRSLWTIGWTETASYKIWISLLLPTMLSTSLVLRRGEAWHLKGLRTRYHACNMAWNVKNGRYTLSHWYAG